MMVKWCCGITSHCIFVASNNGLQTVALSSAVLWHTAYGASRSGGGWFWRIIRHGTTHGDLCAPMSGSLDRRRGRWWQDILVIAATGTPCGRYNCGSAVVCNACSMCYACSYGCADDSDVGEVIFMWNGTLRHLLHRPQALRQLLHRPEALRHESAFAWCLWMCGRLAVTSVRLRETQKNV